MNRTEQAQLLASVLKPRLRDLDTKAQGDVLDEALSEAVRLAGQGDTRIWVTFGAWLAGQYDTDYAAFNRWCRKVLKEATR